MFFSISKKILYSLMAFLIFTIILFLVIFINLYSQKIEENQNSIFIRNQYVVDLLYDNIAMKKELIEIKKLHPDIVDMTENFVETHDLNVMQQELTQEQKLNAELRKSYDNNREAIKTGAQVIGLGLCIVIVLIMLIMFLLNNWVVKPTETISEISQQVSSGVYSSRVPIKSKGFFRDEFDILYAAFNKMLDSIENNISETKRREQFLQNLLDTIPDGIRVIDENYNVVMSNKAFGKILKTKNSYNVKCYYAYGYDCEGCSSSKYKCPIELFRKQKDGTLHTIHEVNKKPLYVNAARLYLNNQSYFVIEAIHDLSRDVHFSHQQKVSSLAFLSTSIAHEMKNNLGAIRIILEGVLDSDDFSAPQNKKYLEMSLKQLVETIKIPERLLQIAHYSEDEISPINVENAVKDMMLMVDYDAKRYGISTITEMKNRMILYGNEADFKMIILNLLQNSIKAMPNGGVLKILCEKKKNKFVINVIDQGIGIDEDKLKHIFEPFYSANDMVRSSGLGLAIVKRLVEKMNGHIYVQSVVNKGTTFTMKFPQDNMRKNIKANL